MAVFYLLPVGILVNTQMRRIIKEVAVLIDSRTNQSEDFQNAVAITALGTIGEVEKSDRDSLSQIYVSKHPQLADFLNESSNALMEVDVNEYVVATFESVRYLSLKRNK